jgi:hypothetical protein
MNKRIHELAREAGLPTYNPEGIPTKLEKFAELIMQEPREWVGLTGNERDQLCLMSTDIDDAICLAEAKLKEKNNP